MWCFCRLRGRGGVVALFCWCSRVCPLRSFVLLVLIVGIAVPWVPCALCSGVGVVILVLVSWFGVVAFVSSLS